MKYKAFASKMRKDLYRNLKLISAAEGKPIQALLEEAVEQYIENRGFKEEPLKVKKNMAYYSVTFAVPKDKEESEE